METHSTHRSFLRRTFRPLWTDLGPIVLGDTAQQLDISTARLWSLVLASRHIPHRMHRKSPDGTTQTIQVQEWFAARAAEEIRLYLEENTPGSGSVHLPDLRPVSGREPTIAAMTILLLFFWAYGRTYPRFALYPKLWLDLGSADAGAILNGEWWRTITALTLHADGAHALGNAAIGGVFIWLVSRRLGAGLAWLLTIVAGGLGNLCNSAILSSHHNAIGFSTASFGAAGILAAIAPFAVGGGIHGLGQGSLTRRATRFIGSAMVPFAAGLGLLAMLGAGENTDLGAHLFGFLSGMFLGFVTGGIATRLGLPNRSTDTLLYAIAVCIPLFSWTYAWLA